MSPLSIATRVKLNSGNEIPQLGFGVYQSPPDVTTNSVQAALSNGYLHIDSAQMYKNEAEAAKAIAASGSRRSDLFFTTKINYQSTDATTKEKMLGLLEESHRKADLGHIDLIIIHLPKAGAQNRKMQWQALEDFKKAGKVKSIGVSNYGVRHLQELLEYAKEPVSVNQIEIHPWCQQRRIVDFCQQHGILIEAYCPLVQATKSDDPTLTAIAKETGKSWTQVLIRWSLQKGFVPLPKSDTPSRIASNVDVYDFELSDAQVKRLDDLQPDVDERCCWNPTDAP